MKYIRNSTKTCTRPYPPPYAHTRKHTYTHTRPYPQVALYQQLLRLYGRLGLITAHSKKLGAVGEDGEASGAGGPEPEVVFEDDSGDDDEELEVEDPFALEGSEEGDSDRDDSEASEGEDDLMGEDDEDEDEDESD